MLGGALIIIGGVIITFWHTTAQRASGTVTAARQRAEPLAE